MANFWDELNQQAQLKAGQGMSQNWADFEKLQRIQELADQRKKQQKDTAKKGNLFTDLLPTFGGTGGALAGGAGGAAIGTAILPGIGTAAGGLLGAILGGAGGSAAGKVGENALEGEKDLGKDVLSEALIGGATSIPLTAGAKFARAGIKAATGFGAKGSEQLLREGAASAIPNFAKGSREIAMNGINKNVVPQVASTGAVSNIGTDLQRRATGVGKVADSYTQEKSIVDTLNRNGLTGSATNIYKNIDGTLGNLSNEAEAILAKNAGLAPRPRVINNLRTTVTDLLPEDPTYLKEINRSLERLNKSGSGDVTASELFSFKKDLGNRLKPAFDKQHRGAPLTAKEEVDMALWGSLDKNITSMAPEVKKITLDQSALIRARPGVKSASEQTAGIPILGIKSQKLKQVQQSAMNKAGQIMSGGAPGAASADMVRGQGLMLPVRQGLAQSYDDAGAAPVQLDENGLAQEDYQTLANEGITGGANDPSMDSTPDPTQNAFGVSKEQVGQAMVAALQSGDLKGFSSLKDLYGLIAAESATKDKPMSAEASKTVGNANTGLQSLSQLESILAQQGGKVSPGTLVPFREAFGNLGSNALGTAGYDTATKNIADVISRLRTGAAITPTEEAYYKSMLPQTFDSPDVISQKLQTFRDLFQSVSSRTGSSSNLEDVLAGLN